MKQRKAKFGKGDLVEFPNHGKGLWLVVRSYQHRSFDKFVPETLYEIERHGETLHVSADSLTPVAPDVCAAALRVVRTIIADAVKHTARIEFLIPDAAIYSTFVRELYAELGDTIHPLRELLNDALDPDVRCPK
jgi:hypothetical protein